MLKHALAFLAFVAISWPALGQTAFDCSPGQAKVQAVAQTRALMDSMSESMDRQKAELDAAIRVATTRAGWSEQDRASFFQALVRSTPNTGFDRQIEALTTELRGMLQALQRDEIRGHAANCRFVARVRELVGQLKSVHERQTVHFIQQLNKVKPVRRP